MKKAILILGIAATALAVSCNKEASKINETKVFEGDKAYVVVNINGVSTASTRATVGDGGYLSGSEAEHAINDAHFYFYDSDGVFVTESGAWNENGTAYSDGNSVEYKANMVVTLTGLTSNKYPNWVVTLLNAPENFSAPKTLEEFAGELAEADSDLYQTENDVDTYFSMTTASFDGSTLTPTNVYTGTDGYNYYFATPVKEENFIVEDVTYDTDGVTPIIPDGSETITIYVERLAAKVTLATSLTATTIDEVDYYTLTQDLVEGDETVSENLYIKFNGWKLNATARKSNFVKDIDASWTNDGTGTNDLGTGWTWNDVDNCRSYWGKCWFYGQGYPSEYPTTGSNGNYDDDEEGTGDDEPLSDYLKYTSLSVDLNEVGAASTALNYLDCEYCAENTNTAAIEAIPSALTSILISATVYSYNAENQLVATDLIHHGNQYYTLDSYLALAQSHIPTVYYQSGDDTYALLDYTCLEVSTDGLTDGKVKVVLKSAYADVTLYDPGDDNTFVESSTTITDVTTAIANFNTNYGSDANYYNGGLMYYNIPIQHLNDNYDTVDGDGNTVVYEANYGVVRNHWYHGTVSAISGLGKGIADEKEVIVPTPETDTYALTAQVNILEWRYVTWDIQL